MFKKILFQLHWFLGITAGLILSIVGVTGAIYSYDQQILRWINHDSYVVKAEQRDKMTPEQLYQHFTAQQPNLKINSISISASPTESSVVNIVKEGERRGYNMMVNPYTAEVLPEVQGRGFFQGVQSLHRWLTIGKIGDREIGKQIVGASTLILIFFVLSGLFLRLPRKHSFRQWFVVKTELKGRNFLWDLHAVVGTWVAIFYLILACTGLYWSYDWWRNGMYKVLGVQKPTPQMQQKKEPSEAPKPLTNEDIARILGFTWQNATAQIGREYSTITLNVPKHATGKIDISYVDAIPQHERARNSVSFDYDNNTIVKHDIYEDKKLNEKIMSSMLPVHRGSFFGGIYQFFAMISALLMPLFFITGWILYIKRREQKILAEQAKQNANIQESDQQADWLIVYATQSGMAEQLAWQTAQSLQTAQQSVAVRAIQQLKEAELSQQPHLLMIASTFGTGEAPDLAVDFVNATMSQNLDLSQVKFAVLALGSKEYADTFCLFGHQLAGWLEGCGATPLFETIEVDNGNLADIQRWNTALAQVSNLDLGTIQLQEKAFHSWTLVQRDVLNTGTTGQLAFNIELENAEHLTWQAGDIAEIETGNSQQRIEQFINSFAGQYTLETTLQNGETFANALRHKDLTAEIDRSVDIDAIVEKLADLPHREYSIASIPTPNAQTQRLRLVVRQHKDEQGELGLGSGWLTEHLAVGEQLNIHLRANPSFHVIDDERPMICIGNGTGIAGLMSLIHARAERQQSENWLIFGERQRECDFFYQEQLQTWLDDSTLQRLDTAFSRDQAEKIYVQDVLRQCAEDVKAWVERGAVIYVCGSIDGMATGVDNALKDILGENILSQLRQDNRYRRDVY